jgi:hypothetical protein
MISKKSKALKIRQLIMIYDKEQIRMFDWYENNNSTLVLINFIDDQDITSKHSTFYKLSEKEINSGTEIVSPTFIVNKYIKIV